MPLLEHEALRIAEALDDYETLSVVDVGGAEPSGYWLLAEDERDARRHEIRSWLDYWTFLTRLTRSLGIASSPEIGHAVTRPSGAGTFAAGIRP